jgi:hypothetical protein
MADKPKVDPAITQLSGFEDVENLREAMPTSIDDNQPAQGTKEKKKRAPRAKSATPSASAPNLMDDKRYAEACAEMSAFGGKRIIIRGFDAGAVALDDSTFRLEVKEEREWDNFFYVLSKKPMFDVGNPWFLAAFFILKHL